MQEDLSITGINLSEIPYNGSFQNSSYISDEDDDVSIFASYSESSEVSEDNIELLNEKLDSVESENGVILSAWNNIKETTGLGTSVDKCDEAVEKYKNGEITYDEASEIIDNYAAKQESSLNLFSNIATSIIAIGAVAAVTVMTGGIGTAAAIAIGAGTGAVAKSGFKLTDRATNDVEGDALDAKQIAQDAISGAVTGGLATATMGTAGGASCAKEAAIKCAKTGVKTGAVSGAFNYVTDCALDEDKDFNIGEFAASTATGAAIGATVGAVMGGANGMLRSSGVLNSGCDLQTMVSSSENASIGNVAANSACTASYKVLNDRISAIAT